MVFKPVISRAPDLRWLIIAGIQLVTTVALVLWWGHLLIDQARQTAELQRELKLPQSEIAVQLDKFERMVNFEATWFLATVIVATIILVAMYLRDRRRTRSFQSFFASLTHELKTPLTSVRLQAESIAEPDIDDEYRSELIARLLQDTHKLENQVERALELARVEGGGRLNCSPQNLKTLLERSLRHWDRAQGQGAVKINVEPTEELIYVDTHAFLTIFKNLAENSVKHGKAKPLEISIRIAKRGTNIVLGYSDNGGGSQLESSRLGQLFARGKESAGAGVGLYLVKTLMMHMSGELVFLHKPGSFACELVFKSGAEKV